MNVQSNDERDGWICLVHLLPRTQRAPSRTKLLTTLADCLGGGAGERGAAGERAERALARCERNKWVTSAPARITERGRKALRRGLGLRKLPEVSSLREARERVLLPAVLGRDESGLVSADAVAAQLLAARHGLPSGPSLRAVVDRLAWRELGVDTCAPFDAAHVQRHLLRALVPADARVSTQTWRRLIAMKAAGARRADKRELARSAVRQWAHQPAAAPEAKPARAVRRRTTELLPSAQVSENQNGKPAAPTRRQASALAPFAAAVLAAARGKNVSKHFDDRAFIGSVWEHMRDRAPVHDMTLAQFKKQLVLAHRAGHLRIACADLITIMDPRELARSEAEYLGAKFHFVKLEAGGSR